MPEDILAVESLTKKFGGFAAVDEATFNIPKTETRGLIGPNGAGKTTLFNLITGIYKPTSGKVVFKGEDVTGMKPHALAAKGICRSYQQQRVFVNLNVLTNVIISCIRSERSGSSTIEQALESDDLRDKAEDILSRLKLNEVKDRQAGFITHGRQRLLEIAMVLANDPEILLLDEPTAGLAPSEAGNLLDIVEEVIEGRTAIVVEHNVEAVMRMSDKITVLHQGSVLQEGEPEEIQSSEKVQEAYLGGLGGEIDELA